MTTSTAPTDDLNLLHDLVRMAQKAGADQAEVSAIDVAAQSVSWHNGQMESLERAESGDLGLRVLIGKRQAVVSSTDRKPSALASMVERAVAMARLAPEDPFCGLAADGEFTTTYPTLDLADATEVSAETLIAQVKEMEAAALAVPGVAQCESADASSSSSISHLVTSAGFAGSSRRSYFSLSSSVLAGTGTGMERDYDFASTVYHADLPSAATIGQRAAENAVKRLNARKMPTGQVPVVFAPRVANSLLRALTSALSGANIARGVSFLKDKSNTQIFPETITIIDDPFRARGLRSRAFDGEGLLPEKRNIIDQGRLTSWFLDLRSARQLGLRPTGHAARSAGSLPAPAPSNFFMEAGILSPAELIHDIKDGFYVTDLMGMGVSIVTGDYSQAAAGFWIENGQITFPVNEMTIAGHLGAMFMNLTPANDLTFTYGVDAPTLRIEGMTVAGV